jgi:hypothetical protein
MRWFGKRRGVWIYTNDGGVISAFTVVTRLPARDTVTHDRKGD